MQALSEEERRLDESTSALDGVSMMIGGGVNRKCVYTHTCTICVYTHTCATCTICMHMMMIGGGVNRKCKP